MQKITAQQIAQLPENDGMLLMGTTANDECRAIPERFACFKPARMAQYVESLFQQCTGHALRLVVTEQDGSTTVYKVAKK